MQSNWKKETILAVPTVFLNIETGSLIIFFEWQVAFFLFLFRSKSHNFATQSWQGLVVAEFLNPPLFFFSSMEVRFNGCLTTSHPERLLRKTINSSIVHCFALLMPILAHWPEDSQNYHVVQTLILSCKIFHIYDNSPVV